MLHLLVIYFFIYFSGLKKIVPYRNMATFQYGNLVITPPISPIITRPQNYVQGKSGPCQWNQVRDNSKRHVTIYKNEFYYALDTEPKKLSF